MGVRMGRGGCEEWGEMGGRVGRDGWEDGESWVGGWGEMGVGEQRAVSSCARVV